MKRFAVTLALMTAGFFMASAQSQMLEDFKPLADSLSVWLKDRTTVKSEIELKKIMRRGNVVDIYFTNTFSDWSWSKADIHWVKKTISENLSGTLGQYRLGRLFCNNVPVEDLVTPRLDNSGIPLEYRYAVKDPARPRPFIVKTGARRYARGLDGRYIALWQSHGRYYNANEARWKWQRPPLHRTVEDLFTQTFVLPFLIPMLENAGAYVMTPRERDVQSAEFICDNDKSFEGARGPMMRHSGLYEEKGQWSDAGEGFADIMPVLSDKDNPFIAGTVRKAGCSQSAKASASVSWTPLVQERGRYAVYVSYKSLKNSSRCARYAVQHMGGRDEFVVDQSMGGGTWIYLGTFEFAPGEGSCVTLDNSTPSGCRYVSGSVVTADAVRFGGGMGKVARGSEDEDKSLYATSGMPCYAEGAEYSMLWSGMDPSLFEEWDSDYVKDFAGRGTWVKWLKNDKGIPFDLSLGFHSDAGVTPSDSTVGTLSIYTLKAEGSRKFSGGKGDRMSGRLLCDFVQSQVCRDVRSDFNPEWGRRQIWDRSYSESRTTDVPGMILELLSHQNFADMKYGLDPAFRFTVSRSVYKGILKFLSYLYGKEYVVQPLPVSDFSALLARDGKLRLTWKAVSDPKEPTAIPTGYVVHTRVDDGVFDAGVEVRSPSYTVALKPGHVYSFKVEAFNDGGLSFPSEILSAGMPSSAPSGETVLVVNNFDRVSAPAWFDTPAYAGFDGRLDGGVPYVEDLGYIGDIYEFRRSMVWKSDEAPGFGASYADCAPSRVAGNTFDYPYVHGRELMALGRAFCSQSASAFSGTEGKGYGVLDLICGKQVTCPGGRYRVYPSSLRKALSSFTGGGGSVIISGSDIATDAWDEIYPGVSDEEYRQDASDFVKSVFGFKFLNGHGSHDGRVYPIGEERRVMQLVNSPSPECYCVENPDAIRPTGTRGTVICKYAADMPAAVAFRASTHSAVSFGFPLECLDSRDDMRRLLSSALEFIGGQDIPGK